MNPLMTRRRIDWSAALRDMRRDRVDRHPDDTTEDRRERQARTTAGLSRLHNRTRARLMGD